MRIGNIDAIIDVIEINEKFIILPNLSIEGDALGAGFGLKEVLEFNFKEKQIAIACSTPNKFDSLFDFQYDEISDEFWSQATIIILGSATTLDKDIQKKIAKNTIIQIDFSDDENVSDDNKIQWINSTYTSVSEQIVDLSFQANWKLTTDSASILYLGVYAGSNKFLNPATSSRTFALASFLLASDFDIQLIHNEINKIKD